MEKKGDILNQLAIISDLLEKFNVRVESKTIVFELSKVEFEKVLDYIQKKYGKRMEAPDGKFNISIGEVEIVFNTSNV
jgi:CRP-like cAMP-binding protein